MGFVHPHVVRAAGAPMLALAITAVLGAGSAVAQPVPAPPVGATSPPSGSVFGSPFEVAPTQATPRLRSTRALAPAAEGNGCTLYAQTIAHSNSTTTHKAWVACTDYAPVQVEECPYVNVGGSLILAADCVVEPPDGTDETTYIWAQDTIHCSPGAAYYTWGWDYVPVSSTPTQAGFSGEVTCR